MNGLHITPAKPGTHACGHLDAGFRRHLCGQVLPRHHHAPAFAAVILAGHYVEAGDAGLHRVTAGDVLFHAPHEWHLDRVGRSGAGVLVLPMPAIWNGPVHARVDDPGTLAVLAERDVRGATEQLQAMWRAVPVEGAADWPEQLAHALLADPALSISDWARRRGLHPGSVSRGFRQVFEISPKAFRLHARTHMALRLRRERVQTAITIANECGFADQAHLSRSIALVTGTRLGGRGGVTPCQQPRDNLSRRSSPARRRSPAGAPCAPSCGT